MFAVIFNLTSEMQTCDLIWSFFLIHLNIIWTLYKPNGIMTLYGEIDLVSVNLVIVYDGLNRDQNLFGYRLVAYDLWCKTNAWPHGDILTIRLL